MSDAEGILISDAPGWPEQDRAGTNNEGTP
jgi:hypothetical protein